MALSLALTRRANLQCLSVVPSMLSWRIGRGYSTSRLEVVSCKEEFELDSHRVIFETSAPDQGSGGGIVLTMQNSQSLSKVFSTVSASPILPDVISNSSPRLKVDYQGNQFPAHIFLGRVCESFVRRESARIIRTPLRPLFPAHFYHDVEVMAKVLCCDGQQDRDIMAANATSAALMLSDIPWGGPIGVVRVARVQGQFVINPSRDELFYADLDLVYGCTRERTVMVDVHAREVTEKDLEEALQLAHRQAVKYLAPQIMLAEKAGIHKKDYTLTMLKESTVQKIMSLVEPPSEALFPDSENEKINGDEVLEKITIDVKRVPAVEKNEEEKFKVLPNINILKKTIEGAETLDKLTEDVKRILDVEEHNKEKMKVIPKMVDMLKKKAFSRWISEKQLRVDGRHLDKVRRTECESAKMSELQGSSFFACGATQVICTVTQRRPEEDEAENLGSDPLLRVPRYSYKSRPFRVDGNLKIGDCDGYEAGDGNFVEKALVVLLPVEYRFPYIVRVNSQVTHSDGSVSTATVCGGSIALMASGLPLKKPVSAVSVGIIGDVHPSDVKMNNYQILSDLSSLEEDLVDMNVKVAGTRDGITAIRLDVNVAGVPLDIVCECLGPALRGRLEILDQMEQEISAPSYCTSDDWGWSDAVVVTYRLPSRSIELLNGLDGAWQNDFERETGARIAMIVDDGEITVAAKNKTSHMLAKQKVESIIRNEVEAGWLLEDEATQIKCYVEANGSNLVASEIPIEQVDPASDKRCVVQRQKLPSIGISGEDQLHRRENLDFKMEFYGLSEFRGDISDLYESYDFSELSDSGISDSLAKL